MPSCPKSKAEWQNAANFKNCNVPAVKQKCTNATEFVYHCVIDGFQKETLEVCAPRKLIHGNILTYILLKIRISIITCFLFMENELIIVNVCLLLGFCAEFNVAGGVIQNHYAAPCDKETFPKCNELYKSSEAYKCKEAYLLNFILIF